jgi:hypothetical protein
MATYIQIGSTVTVGSGGSATIDFTSIPSTYTDLVLVASLRSTGTGTGSHMTFNGSTTGYDDLYVQGAGSGTPVSGADAGANTKIYVGNLQGTSTTSNTFCNTSIYIPNYAGSAYKSVSVDTVNENNNTTAYAAVIGGLWSNTSAITSIQLLSAQTFAQYSTASLYGIKKD